MSAPKAIHATTAAPRTKPSNYPAVFAARMENRLKRPLGDLFGLTNFGVNLTTIHPGGESALLHSHSKQDEFIYLLEGELELHQESGITRLTPGMCAGFPKSGEAHALRNTSTQPATYLEIGDRTPADHITYPQDDLVATLTPSGQWAFTRKTGEPY